MRDQNEELVKFLLNFSLSSLVGYLIFRYFITFLFKYGRKIFLYHGGILIPIYVGIIFSFIAKKNVPIYTRFKELLEYSLRIGLGINLREFRHKFHDDIEYFIVGITFFIFLLCTILSIIKFIMKHKYYGYIMFCVAWYCYLIGTNSFDVIIATMVLMILFYYLYQILKTTFKVLFIIFTAISAFFIIIILLQTLLKMNEQSQVFN